MQRPVDSSLFRLAKASKRFFSLDFEYPGCALGQSCKGLSAGLKTLPARKKEEESPSVWNSLPSSICPRSSLHTLCEILKTGCLEQAFSSPCCRFGHWVTQCSTKDFIYLLGCLQCKLLLLVYVHRLLTRLQTKYSEWSGRTSLIISISRTKTEIRHSTEDHCNTYSNNTSTLLHIRAATNHTITFYFVAYQFFSNHFRLGFPKLNCLELFYKANALPFTQQQERSTRKYHSTK